MHKFLFSLSLGFAPQGRTRTTERNGLWFNEKTVVRWIWRTNCSLPKRWFRWKKFSGVNIKADTKQQRSNGIITVNWMTFDGTGKKILKIRQKLKFDRQIQTHRKKNYMYNKTQQQS